jgi:hypothetical protein
MPAKGGGGKGKPRRSGHKRKASLNARGLGKPKKKPKKKPPLSEEEMAAVRLAARSEPPKPGQYNPFGLHPSIGKYNLRSFIHKSQPFPLPSSALPRIPPHVA